MKVLINRRVVEGPWGGGNKFTKALKKYLLQQGHTVVDKFENDIDIIHLQDVHSDQLGIDANVALTYKYNHNPKTKIVHRVNDMDLGRYDSNPWRDDVYKELSKYSDASIFVSEWTRDFFLKKGWFSNNNFVVYNGVDKDIFCERKKINNGKVNIVTHHWSNNKGKGFDIYEKIDDFVSENKDYTFTYIGRERGTFKNTKVIPPLFGIEIGEELSKYNLYVSASEYENCPNHILESLACNIPTYAIEKGGASLSLVGKDFVFKDWENLKSILIDKNFKANSTTVMSWEQCIEQYIMIYEKILEGKNENTM